MLLVIFFMFFADLSSVVCEIGPKRKPPNEGKVEVEVNDNKRGMSRFSFTYRVGILSMHLFCSTMHVYSIGLNPNSPLSQAGGNHPLQLRLSLFMESIIFSISWLHRNAYQAILGTWHVRRLFKNNTLVCW